MAKQKRITQNVQNVFDIKITAVDEAECNIKILGKNSRGTTVEINAVMPQSFLQFVNRDIVDLYNLRIADLEHTKAKMQDEYLKPVEIIKAVQSNG